MNLSISAMRLCSSIRAKRLLVQAFAVLTVFGSYDAYAQTWEYLSYDKGQPSAPGFVTLDEKSGKPVFRMIAGNLDTCYQGDIDATVARTEATTIITIVPRLRGCEEVRFVIKNDGTGGQREVKRASEWRWDRSERGLTPRK